MLLRFADPATLLEIDVDFLNYLVGVHHSLDDVHLSDLVQIYLTNHKIIHSGHWPVNRVDLVILRQLYVEQSEGLDLHAGAPEFRFDFCVDPDFVLAALAFDVAG